MREPGTHEPALHGPDVHEPNDLRDEGLALLVRAGLPPPLARPAGASGAFGAQGGPFDISGTAGSLAPLLQAVAAATAPAPSALRRRLLQRVADSARGARALHTQRHADTVPAAVAAGVTLRLLYRAATAGRARRPGEPDAVALVELAPGASWAAPAAGGVAPDALRGLQSECLVLRGSVRVGSVPLHVHDYHVRPAGTPAAEWSSEGGALLYLRESQPMAEPPTQPVAPSMQPFTQHADAAAWADYAPGIKRRVMWQQGAQAAMLYHALPGAAVPHHGHGHDEECLMLAGDFFLDEVLLRTGDYQIAPAGTEHHLASTDTGVLIYAHGDIDLDLK
ncbi:MAG: cupin domain-containing protein [Burkholderiales bacterium]|nr:cupin domain-containing protein [Burkholderiales bacterium]